MSTDSAPGSHLRCGSAFQNTGVQPMLDAVVDYLPSPLDGSGTDGRSPHDESVVIHRNASSGAPFAALVFKIASHPPVLR